MRQGDKVVLISDIRPQDRLEMIKLGVEILTKENIYVIAKILTGTTLHLEGVNHGNCAGYWMYNFRKVDDQSMAISTEASRELSDLFKERDGCREHHPDEKKHLEEEKVFTIKERF